MLNTNLFLSTRVYMQVIELDWTIGEKFGDHNGFFFLVFLCPWLTANETTSREDHVTVGVCGGSLALQQSAQFCSYKEKLNFFDCSTCFCRELPEWEDCLQKRQDERSGEQPEVGAALLWLLLLFTTGVWRNFFYWDFSPNVRCINQRDFKF